MGLDPESDMREKLAGLSKQRDRKTVVAAAATIVVLLALILVSTSMYNETLVLDNTTKLEYIDGNSVGSMIVSSGSPIPMVYKEPDMEACLYTSKDRAPVIVPVKVEKPGLISPGITEIRLSVDLPEESLEDRNYDQNFSIESGQRCPVSSEPKIILKRVS